MRDWHGQFPSSAEELQSLPGIGRSTAGAIAAFCSGVRAPILDGNVRRVLCRHFAIEGDPTAAATIARLWELAESLLPSRTTCRRDPNAMASYTQGLMDLGACVCTRSAPNCIACPLASTCIARAQNRTHALPSPRARRAQPQREVGVLIATCGGKLLLERRAPKGIWGGLWSLPEFRVELDPASACGEIGIVAASIRPMAPFAHTFTHFCLTIRPWLVHAQFPVARDALASHREWFDVDALDGAGMPAPVRKLLSEVIAAGLVLP